MYVFIEATIEYVDDFFHIRAGNDVINVSYLPQEETNFIMAARPEKVFIKYARASSGKFDKDDNWIWDVLAPFTDENHKLVLKYHQSSYTREELVETIREHESKDGKIPNPIGLLNEIFKQIGYPYQNSAVLNKYTPIEE